MYYKYLKIAKKYEKTPYTYINHIEAYHIYKSNVQMCLRMLKDLYRLELMLIDPAIGL